MAILTMPAGISMTGANLRPMKAFGVQTSPYTFAQAVQVFPGERWELELEFLPTDRAEAAKLEAWTLSLNGPVNQVRLGDPFRSLPLGSAAGTPVFDLASSTAGLGEIGTRGWTASAAGVLLANDLVQLGDQLFAVLEDVDADGSGEAVVKVWPALRALASDGDPLTVANPRGLFQLASQPGFGRTQAEIFTATTLQFVEVVS